MHGDNEEFLEADDMAKASGKGRHVKAGRSVAEDGSCDIGFAHQALEYPGASGDGPCNVWALKKATHWAESWVIA